MIGFLPETLKSMTILRVAMSPLLTVTGMHSSSWTKSKSSFGTSFRFL